MKKPKLLAGILASPSPVQFHIRVSAHVSIQYLQQADGNICNAYALYVGDTWHSA